MILLLAAGCETREPLVDESRQLSILAGPDRTWTWEARLNGWHYSAGWGDAGPHRAYDAVYVGWELAGDRSADVKGDVDQVWSFDSLEAGRARYDALQVERCASDERLGFQVLGGDEPRVRVVVPDRAGAVVGLGASEDCAAELAAVGSAEDWRRDRSAGVAVCQHLYRLPLRGYAIRCELREPSKGGTALATRQDLPSAPDDPRFDRELLAVLASDAPGDRSGFVPYRVSQLLAEVGDKAAMQEVARGIAASTERSPWRAEVLGLVGTADALTWVDEGVDTPEKVAIAQILLTAFPDRGRLERLRTTPPVPDCPPPLQVAPGKCPDLGALAATLDARHGPISSCPPEEAVGALHAAVYQLEHGDVAAATLARDQARRLTANTDDPRVVELLRGLDQAFDTDDAASRILQTEELRVQLGDWACLTPQLHQRLHEALPPIPGRPSSGIAIPGTSDATPDGLRSPPAPGG